MTIEKQQHDENEKNTPLAVVDKAAFGESRRRFTKAGIAASGVLVTLASRPALGCTVGVSPSVYCSGNVSGHGTSNTSNPGCPPYYWTGNCDHGWPHSITQKTKFEEVFKQCSKTGRFKALYGKTVPQVLQGVNGDPSSCGKNLLTAYMNNAAGKAPFLSQLNITNMFYSLQNSATYVPTSGAKAWNMNDVNTYLAGTWD
ncbi:hypothetical protein ACO0LO_08790 [Undibacterium sp. TJN25]|uniref:hypothetical protein n=1 Tax=Undibacterium sp. TJN25 TaxID=3413056 RepID=UPI003BF43590